MWIYYFEDYEWQPWENTLLYFEFEQNLNDSSWKWNNATSSTWIWYEEVWWQYVVKSTTSPSWISCNPSVWNIGTSDFYFGWRMNMIKPWNNVYSTVFWIWHGWSQWWVNHPWPTIFAAGSSDVLIFRTASNDEHNSSVSVTSLAWSWHYISFTRLNWVCTWYVDCIDVTGSRSSSREFANCDWSALFFRSGYWPRSTGVKWDKLIFENQWRELSKIKDYYNSTKSLYWIS